MRRRPVAFALDTMLDNNYYKNYNEFGPCNPLCLIDGALYADAQKDPPQLRLCGLGNPVDVPVEVSIDQPSDWALVGPSFREGPNGCKVGGAAGSCTLQAASGIASSNDSTVSTSDPPPPPLESWPRTEGIRKSNDGRHTHASNALQGRDRHELLFGAKAVSSRCGDLWRFPTAELHVVLWQQCESAK